MASGRHLSVMMSMPSIVTLSLHFQPLQYWCFSVVGGKKRSARGHFRHAGVDIKDSELLKNHRLYSSSAL